MPASGHSPYSRSTNHVCLLINFFFHQRRRSTFSKHRRVSVSSLTKGSRETEEEKEEKTGSIGFSDLPKDSGRTQMCLEEKAPLQPGSALQQHSRCNYPPPPPPIQTPVGQVPNEPTERSKRLQPPTAEKQYINYSIPLYQDRRVENR